MKQLIILCAIVITGCSKKLELKPSSSLLVPETIQDFEAILDNTEIMNMTSALPQMAADEYYIPTLANYQALTNPITNASYTWEKDIYQGRTQIKDWNFPYAQVFICNSVLDILSQKDVANNVKLKIIKGWALFNRAYAFYTLVSVFSKAYDSTTASSDLGIPLRLSAGVASLVQRSSVQQTYDQLINDAIEASSLLQPDIPATKRNRPSQVSCYAFLARVYISMRKYNLAEVYADKAFALYSTLIDYNTLPVSPTLSSWSDHNSTEVIYYSRNELVEYSQTTYSSGALYGVDTNLRKSYHVNDLRRTVYFRINANGNWAVSKGINVPISYPFTGLATDEIILIKAECLARRNQKDDAMFQLNKLLRTRFKTGTYTDLTATSANEALDKILEERKKELIWRCIRWTDIKRFNLEGRNITLTRNLEGTIYTLEPNSSRYVLPIPDDEIALSGIEQNIR
jgi:starch-binding outer membrane protein, SusD/RagB family